MAEAMTVVERRVWVERNVATLGFALETTGGGCMAYIKDVDVDKGVRWILTDPSGVDVPQDMAESCLLGFYGSDEDEGHVWTLVSVWGAMVAVGQLNNPAYGAR